MKSQSTAGTTAAAPQIASMIGSVLSPGRNDSAVPAYRHVRATQAGAVTCRIVMLTGKQGPLALVPLPAVQPGNAFVIGGVLPTLAMASPRRTIRSNPRTLTSSKPRLG
jgi:hypothetical protein